MIEEKELHTRLMKLKNCIIDMKMNPNYSFKLNTTINKLFPEIFNDEDHKDDIFD